MQNKHELLNHLKEGLHLLHNDWEKLLQQEPPSIDAVLLTSFAKHILQLDQNAKEAALISDLKEKAQLLHFALSTPWGAPFVGETTLLEAATAYKEENTDSSLQHLLINFIQYGHEQQAPLFKVFDEISEELLQD